MSQQQKVDLRRALFLSGLQQGLDAEALHEFIEDGLRLAEVVCVIERERPELRDAS